MDGSNLELN